MTPPIPPTPAPNVELELAKLANDAMANGADPHDVTGKLHQTISYLRQFPKMAEHATNALADGVATPADISRTLWPHVEALSHATGSNAPTPEEAANLPGDVTPRSRLGGGLASFVSGVPGGEALTTGVHALTSGQPYRDAYRDVKAAEASSPIRTPLRIAGGGMAALALPGSAAVSGAVVGGADQALNANPDVDATGRTWRTAAGAAGGAVLGKTGEKLVTAGKALLPSWLGGVGEGADAAMIRMQSERANSAKQLFDAAMAEGRGKEVAPQIQQFLEEDDIAPIVASIRSGRTGAQMETPELLDRVYKELSEMQKAAKKTLAQADPTKPSTAVSRLADIKAAKQKFLDVVSRPGQKPPLTMDVAPEVADVAPRVTQAERETLQGPVAGGPLRDVTTAPSDPTMRQALRDFPQPATPPAMQGPRGPAFQLRGQAERVTPGVRIETPAMRVQTAPAEDVPPLMPSYKQAVEDYAKRSQEIDALKRGYTALYQKGANRLTAPGNLGRKTPLTFEKWAKTASPEQIEAARRGVLGGVRDATALGGKTLAKGRQYNAAAGPLLTKLPTQSQDLTEALQNLGLVTAGNSTPFLNR